MIIMATTAGSTSLPTPKTGSSRMSYNLLNSFFSSFMGNISSSTFGKVNMVDLWKSIRMGLTVLVTTFVATVVHVVPMVVTKGVFDPKTIALSAGLAGLTAVGELVRRFFTDHGALNVNSPTDPVLPTPVTPA